MKIIVITHRRDSVAAWAFHIHEVGVWVLEKNWLSYYLWIFSDLTHLLWIFGHKSRKFIFSQFCSPGPAVSACASSAHPSPMAAAAPWLAGQRKVNPHSKVKRD